MKDSKGPASPYSYWNEALGDAMADCCSQCDILYWQPIRKIERIF